MKDKRIGISFDLSWGGCLLLFSLSSAVMIGLVITILGLFHLTSLDPGITATCTVIALLLLFLIGNKMLASE